MYEIYTVMPGDTITTIASKYNIDPALIYQINGFDASYTPNVGSNIILPNKTNLNYEYYTIQKGDSLYKIAQNFNTNVKLLALLNGLEETDYIYPNQMILVPKKGVSFYLVKQGDTLKEVIKLLNTNLMDLVNQNNNIYLQENQILAFRENNI